MTPEELAAVRARDAAGQPLAAYDYYSAHNLWNAYRPFIEEATEDRRALLVHIDALEADLSAIYGRMRHTHSDDVSCADAGPKGHPAHLSAPTGRTGG